MPLSAKVWATLCSDSPGRISTSTAWAPMGKAWVFHCQYNLAPPPQAASKTIPRMRDSRFMASGLRRPGGGPARKWSHGVAARPDALHGPHTGDGIAYEYFPALQQLLQGQTVHLDAEPFRPRAFQDMAPRHTGHPRPAHVRRHQPAFGR